MTDLLQTALDGTRIRNSHAMVVHGLGSGMVDGRYPEGSLLPNDDELARLFGVSRTVLREAMKTLAAKGMVVSRSRVGTRVKPRRAWNLFDQQVLAWHLEGEVSPDFLSQLFEMRLSFEPFAAGLAAERADDEAIGALYRHCDAMADAPDERAFALADLEFHRAVHGAAGNAFFHTVITLIEAAMLLALRLSSPAAEPASKANSALKHREIADRIAAGDRRGAEETMSAVIKEGWSRISRDRA
ncbi:GntR family transcriptional regulator [Roseivivax halodurans JCM 10272]|uniref:GntR family transcriptional regulator n=1 Tax=Roseivivax halodurans JCM 10272 TaxID=1449350 RepID=X7EMD4_9RHOB|nr:FadR/GntR family transcriptional regulator [Roseivivax halodurans]ETX16326.1 GntR family transcriptional regulator [Roseivivax halodurans JCM 10272]